MSGKQRTLAQLQEPSWKRLRTCSSEGNHISSMAPQEWSWPKRVDEFASGPYAECLGATDSTGAELTWSQLSQRSKIVAQHLSQRGFTATPASAYRQSIEEVVEAPRPIVVMMGHVVDCLVVHLGVLRRGFPLLPLSILHADKRQLLKRYEEAMQLFEPAAIITDSELAQQLLQHRPQVPVISAQDLLQGSVPLENCEDVPTTTDNVLAYIFTSGTTGQSKCSVVTNRMALAEVEWYPELFSKLGYKVDPHRDRFRQDHEMGWWGAAYFGEVNVALAMTMCIVMMNNTDPDWAKRGVTVTGALPSQLRNMWPGAKNIPSTLQVVFSWAERCDLELGQSWKKAGVKIADLLIATEYFLTFASANLEVARSDDGRAAHAMRCLGGAIVYLLDDELKPISTESDSEVTGLVGIAGPQVAPGYAELISDGRVTIGCGPLSKEAFKVIDGQLVLVPRDIMKRRPDGSFISIGRGGGTIKLKGGVLIATNVAELQLQKGPIVSACITDPLHVEGGSSVVLEMKSQDVWSLRDSLQQASFLRMPILFTRQMPRNPSTGKVQKALVQEKIVADHEVERRSAQELHASQEVQLRWFTEISRGWLTLICAAQPWSVMFIVQAALRLKATDLIIACARFPIEALFQLNLVAWTYAAWAHAGALGLKKSGLVTVSLAFAGTLAGISMWSILACLALMSSIVIFGYVEAASADSKDHVPSFLTNACKGIGRLRFTILVGLMPRLLRLEGMAVHFTIGLFCLIACSRFLPNVPLSLFETLGYMLSFPVPFVLALPSVILSTCPDFSWKRLVTTGRPLARHQMGQAYHGADDQLERVKSEVWRKDGSVWVDVVSKWMDDSGAQEPEKVAAHAESPAGSLAQQLARKAGVDFKSVDSLKIARLSVLLKKHLKPKGIPLEFSEVREACVDEQTFVSLIDHRMFVQDADIDAKSVCLQSKRTLFSMLKSWFQGDAIVHREGATQAPWDCQVDVLFEWHGEHPLDHPLLCKALAITLQQHPMLRACFPPDDAIDNLMGTGGSGFATTAAATWCLLAEFWCRQASWMWSSSTTLRKIMATALWRCWPRTVILKSQPHLVADIPVLSQTTSGWNNNQAEEVYSILYGSWESWWRPRSALNICMVNLDSSSKCQQFLYCSITHKYADGGAAAAFVHALNENYETLLRKEQPSCQEHPILAVQQQRLQNYLEGEACPEGTVDVYIFDIVNSIYQHEYGQSVAVNFTEQVCDVMRIAGLRMSCSEEIAWMACIVCAMFRLLPDEDCIKILLVHNGRLGEAEGAVACVSQYVMLSIPCACGRSCTPIADIASRVKYDITHGRFRRPGSNEQAHARINIGGMAGTVGDFSQVFKTSKSKTSSWSRAPYIIQLRMDNEGGIWCAKDFKCHQILEASHFWQTVVCVGMELSDGCFTNPVAAEQDC
eukprot:TRINITY_DN31177_c0_g1_i1.p1 TRINITY_DN31177_c0_g1~~TRINITY_DN31177_c0_g1_i1.p1  ORF type:complete len:1417 (+),score=245.79 TRINITY_DN31177_c0_g1_i1:108-4358(+)